MDKFIEDLVNTRRFDDDKLRYVQEAKLGLQLLLINLSSFATNRIIKLRKAIDIIEDKITDPDFVRKLRPDDLISYYRLISEVSRTYINFVTNVLDRISWQEVEGQLVEKNFRDKTRAIVNQEIPSEEILDAIAEKLREAKSIDALVDLSEDQNEIDSSKESK